MEKYSPTNGGGKPSEKRRTLNTLLHRLLKMRLLSKECRSKDLCKEIKLYQKHKDLNKNHINYKEEILQNQNESEYDD